MLNEWPKLSLLRATLLALPLEKKLAGAKHQLRTSVLNTCKQMHSLFALRLKGHFGRLHWIFQCRRRKRKLMKNGRWSRRYKVGSRGSFKSWHGPKRSINTVGGPERSALPSRVTRRMTKIDDCIVECRRGMKNWDSWLSRRIIEERALPPPTVLLMNNFVQCTAQILTTRKS